MKFQAVLFDAAETLFTTRGSVGEIYASVAREYGSQARADVIQEAFIKNFHGAGPISVQDQKRWWRDVVHRVFSQVGMVANFDEFFNRVYDVFQDSQGWVLYPETLDVLQKLRELGLKLGIISNFDTRVYSVLDSLRIRDFFDTVTISSETGYSKPDPQIFEAAVRDLGLPASAVLLVGDSPHDDVEAAIQAGLSAILIDRRNRYSEKRNLRRISSLKEVIAEVTS
jgi:putative hydrolase of the HAD superfamily